MKIKARIQKVDGKFQAVNVTEAKEAQPETVVGQIGRGVGCSLNKIN